MKIKIIILGIIAVCFSGCYSPAYLPSSDDIDVNQYGSYIDISCKKGPNVSGELLSIDTLCLMVFTPLKGDTSYIISPVNVENINSFSLRYAKPHNYGWSICLFPALTLAHGWYSMFTAPINLIVTISVTVGGSISFKYDNKEMPLDKLKMFARFPEGVPANIDLNNLSPYPKRILMTK
jgi:hypothetical protein